MKLTKYSKDELVALFQNGMQDEIFFKDHELVNDLGIAYLEERDYPTFKEIERLLAEVLLSTCSEMARISAYTRLINGRAEKLTSSVFVYIHLMRFKQDVKNARCLRAFQEVYDECVNKISSSEIRVLLEKYEGEIRSQNLIIPCVLCVKIREGKAEKELEAIEKLFLKTLESNASCATKRVVTCAFMKCD